MQDIAADDAAASVHIEAGVAQGALTLGERL